MRQYTQTGRQKNDALCENWILSGSGDMYLADIFIEAGYDLALDELLLTEYLERKLTEADWKHFLANKLYVDYLWTLWVKARVSYDVRLWKNGRQSVMGD